MAKGQPDFGALAPTETIVGISDMGELAVRLGSPVIFDRRGNVIFLDDYCGSLSKYDFGSSGSGGSVRISNEWSRIGDFSCKMATGDQEDDYAYVDLSLPFPSLCKLGLEICWYLETYLKDLELCFHFYDGSKNWRFKVGWFNVDDTWRYVDSDDNWQSLSPTMPYAEGDITFSHVKLIIDLENKRYVRLIANNTVYDLSNIAPCWVYAAEVAHMLCEVATVSRVNASCVVYLDSLIVTQNEP